MKTSRCGIDRMIGSRLAIQMSRSLATSERTRSLASRVFFIAETSLAQIPRQRGRIDLDAMTCGQLCRQLRHGDVGLLLDTADQKRTVGIELAGARRTPLWRRLERAPCVRVAK